MPLPTGDVIGLMVDNLKRRKTVFPISPRKAAAWARDLGIPRGGETVLYTGSLYQLLPYMVAAVKNMELMENSILSRMVTVGRFFNRFINVSAFIARPSGADVKRYGGIIRNIARLLQAAGVGFGYLYEDELYAGALAYDMGADAAFEAHAKLVYDGLKQHGVRSLITIDPHTTNMLRSVYPNLIDGYDLEVKSYLEVLAATDVKPVREVSGRVAVHDSCVYARYEGVIDEPRELLTRAGYSVLEPNEARKLTHCCGGPIESLFPGTAHEIGKKRVQQLAACHADGVATMCPICMATLQKAAGAEVRIDDISGYLAKAFCEG